MAKRIRGILFDLGDTLLDFGRWDPHDLFEQGARSAYEYLRGLGKSLPSFEWFHRWQLWVIRWNFFKSRFTRRDFNALDVLGRISRRMGHHLTHAQTMEQSWWWYQPLRKCATVEPEVRDTLKRFRNDGLKLGVISNTFVPGEVLDRHLAQENLLELLPVRVYSCDVRYSKPSAKIFELALERTGLSAGEALFVGDSPKADVRGANRAGLISVLKDPLSRYDGAAVPAVHRIQKIVELIDIVARYNSGK